MAIQKKEITVGRPEDTKGELKRIGGANADGWNQMVANQTIRSLWASTDEEEYDQQISATAAVLTEINSKDPHEGMIAAQLIASHHAAMECYRRAMLPEQSFEGRRENLNQANKLSRTHTSLLEALNRHRGKGQQKMTVEHVHVHEGGKAVVGVVEQGGPNPILEEQPHAKRIGHAPQPEMRCEDPEGNALPVSGDAERAVPDARRNQPRRAKRK